MRSPKSKLLLSCAAALAALLIAFTGAAAAQASTGGAGVAAIGGGSAKGPEQAVTPMRYAGASWYGPGLWGRKTACGVTLRPKTLGVANKALPCGTTVRFVYRGRVLITRVIDRGPYVKGRAWDLTAAAGDLIGLEGVGRVGYSVATNLARPAPRQ
jgi:rare lipoprotein A (peptidoglycan hydrolase)